MNDWAFLLKTAGRSWRAAGRPGRVKAAVSGGADSVALLLVLADLAKEADFHLSCVHVDHGIRPDSGEDAAFVESLCLRLNVPCRVFRVALKGKSEDEARAARYDAMLNGFPDEKDFALALAHHQRDQAETVLLRLFRGSGGEGLSAMAERTARHRTGGEALLWRPFLTISPEVIRRALDDKNVPWREDSTNESDMYLRNYIRHQVLPLIRARAPGAEEAMGRAARVLADEEDFLRREAEKFLRTDHHACLYDPLRWVSYPALREMHPALGRHVIRSACPVKLDWAQTERLFAVKIGETVNLPAGWRAKCLGDKLHFLPPEGAKLPPQPPMKQALLSLPWAGENGDGRRKQAMPRKVYERCALRLWQPGDRIHPLGAPGEKSMQDYFVDKKVPQPFRAYVPLLCVGSQVIWAIGIGPGEEARTAPDGDNVLLRFDGFLPGDCPANER